MVGAHVASDDGNSISNDQDRKHGMTAAPISVAESLASDSSTDQLSQTGTKPSGSAYTNLGLEATNSVGLAVSPPTNIGVSPSRRSISASASSQMPAFAAEDSYPGTYGLNSNKFTSTLDPIAEDSSDQFSLAEVSEVSRPYESVPASWVVLGFWASSPVQCREKRMSDLKFVLFSGLAAVYVCLQFSFIFFWELWMTFRFSVTVCWFWLFSQILVQMQLASQHFRNSHTLLWPIIFASTLRNQITIAVMLLVMQSYETFIVQNSEAALAGLLNY